MKPFAIIVGIGLALFGLFFGTSEIQASDGGDSAKCGSAFSPDFSYSAQKDQLNELARGVLGGTDIEGECRDKVESKKTIAQVLIGVGLVVAIGGIFIRTRRQE